MSDILSAIDAAVDDRCSCGCGAKIGIDSPSAYFATAYCQSKWNARNVTAPDDVYRRPDAADYPSGPMRWRPDMVVADMRPLEPLPGDVEQFCAALSVYNVTTGLDVAADAYVLRLDDGSRYVETTVDPAAVCEWMAKGHSEEIAQRWATLSRQLADERQAEPVAEAPTLAEPTVTALLAAYLRNNLRSRPELRDDGISGASPSFEIFDETHNWDRVTRAFAYAHVGYGRPEQPAAQPDPTYDPQPTVNGDSWSYTQSREWTSALSGPMRWRRPCPECRGITNVVERMVMPRLELTMLSLADPSPMVVDEPMRPEQVLTCGRCRRRIEGPKFLAQYRRPEQSLGYHHSLRLIAGGDIVNAQLAYQYGDYPEAIAMTWEELETRLREFITYRDPCSVTDCTEKARSRYDVRRSVTVGGFTANSGKILLCWRHHHELESQLMTDGYFPMRMGVGS